MIVAGYWGYVAGAYGVVGTGIAGYAIWLTRRFQRARRSLPPAPALASAPPRREDAQ
jgi:hypothetical protein